MIHRFLCAFVALAAVSLLALPAVAATWYADPVNGSAGGDGSAGSPWPSLLWIVDSRAMRL